LQYRPVFTNIRHTLKPDKFLTASTLRTIIGYECENKVLEEIYKRGLALWLKLDKEITDSKVHCATYEAASAYSKGHPQATPFHLDNEPKFPVHYVPTRH
jgi:hypothetical protein